MEWNWETVRGNVRALQQGDAICDFPQLTGNVDLRVKDVIFGTQVLVDAYRPTGTTGWREFYKTAVVDSVLNTLESN